MAKTGKVTLSSIVGETVAEVAPRKRHGLGRGGPALLKQVPLFANLSTHHLRKLASRCEVVRYPANRTVVRQGARGDSFFVIADGTATVKKGTRSIGTLGPGDFFGEIAIMEHDRRTASVVATTPVTAIVMLARDFETMAGVMPHVAEKIHEAIRARMQR